MIQGGVFGKPAFYDELSALRGTGKIPYVKRGQGYVPLPATDNIIVIAG